MQCKVTKSTDGRPCLREALPYKNLCLVHDKGACRSRDVTKTGDQFVDIEKQLHQVIKDVKANKLPAQSANAVTQVCKTLLSLAVEQRKLEQDEALEQRLAALEAALDEDPTPGPRAVA
jgi:hypothetical protein